LESSVWIFAFRILCRFLQPEALAIHESRGMSA
jgi:hypothetical protein